MVETGRAYTADVHAGAFANRLQSFERDDVFGIVGI
jgi:hypothetical protein